MDGTLGAGGHAAALLSAHPELHHLVGLDVDPTALQIAGDRLSDTAAERSCSLHLCRSNYADIRACLLDLGVLECAPGSIDGILLDIGVSSMQVCFLSTDFYHCHW